LNAVDAAGEGLFVWSVAGFVATEDLGDIPESLDAIDDGGFVEAVGGEEFSGALDVIVDGEEARGGRRGAFCRAGETRFGDAEGAEAVPVPLASGAGDHVIESTEGGVERFYVVGFGGWDAGGEIRLGRGFRLRN